MGTPREEKEIFLIMAVNLMHNMQAEERVYDFAEKIAISLQGRQASVQRHQVIAENEYEGRVKQKFNV